ncbi:MAG: MBL fold metallo-hydrolase [Chloroflexota bacterium]|nr:MAG: MBL fold metallo-hydrolase [Chloroflexota bacterium]
METPDVIVKGKDNGEGMVIHYKTTKGTDVFGLAIPNIYTHADWDLGPTWCYLIAGQKITLIDTGRIGNFEVFESLLKSTGKVFSDIDRIIITHSHEDHDGNLAEIISVAQAELWAHKIYRQMISYHPNIRDGATHPELPGSCRLCRMPESFYYENCVPYHRARSSLKIDVAIEDDQKLPDGDLNFLFTPGHSPDALCIILDEEVIFTGDTLLPGITSHPSLAYDFKVNHLILPEEYGQKNEIYGLMNYIKSLTKIARLASQPLKATLPAHRLFYNGRFNLLDSSERAKEVIHFHIDRCRDVLRIVDGKPAGIEDIVVQHFPPSRLSGTGKTLAKNEIRAHLEIMEACGDICWTGENQELVQRTGSENYLDIIGAYSRSS